MKDYLGAYGKRTRKFQEGGAMAPDPGMAGPEAAPMEDPAAAGGGDPQAMLAEYAQTGDPQLAVAICDLLVEMMAAQGGGGPEGGAPAPGPEAAPAMEQGGQMYRNGGSIRRGPVFRK